MHKRIYHLDALNLVLMQKTLSCVSVAHTILSLLTLVILFFSQGLYPVAPLLRLGLLLSIVVTLLLLLGNGYEEQ